jgi:hypothetical protein
VRALTRREQNVAFFPDTITAMPQQPPASICFRVLTQVPPGQGTGVPIVVVSNQLKSQADDVRFEFVSYGAPVITGLNSAFNQDNPTAGSSSVQLIVTGSNFGLSGRIVFGAAGGATEISCTPTGANWQHTRVQCALPPGEGSGLAVTVISAGRQSPAFGSLRYAPASPTSFQVLGTQDDLADTRGGQTLVISGQNFGRPVQMPSVSVGFRPCAVQSSSHSSITCLLPFGEGAGLAVSVTSAGSTVVMARSLRHVSRAWVMAAARCTTGGANDRD